MTKDYDYQHGFGGYWQSEALLNALPKNQLSPQHPPYGLYAEQLSGSAFTRSRHQNLRSWLYRILPSVTHSAFTSMDHPGMYLTSSLAKPTQLRWNALADPKNNTDFINGFHRLLFNGAPEQHQGGAIYLYSANTSMTNTYFYNADGEFLFVPYIGECHLVTELGRLSLSPGEIAVIPRGIRFQVIVNSPILKGYLCENYGSPFVLPDLGPIGSNGLANPKDFQIPTAFFEEKTGNFKLITKFQNHFFEADIQHSPFDVVAWHGNYAPYKYALRYFNAINTVSFDHCDPSIFTVLTSPSHQKGIANIDFVIFPPRWMVAEHTFRPPYYHRNIMSEYMGLITGAYDAKAEGFIPGGGSLHNCMSAHGPDTKSCEQALIENLVPQKLTDTLAFMFESCLPWATTPFAEGTILQKDYQACWKDLKPRFNRDWKEN